jgi:two-component system, OmpR family, response regulator
MNILVIEDDVRISDFVVKGLKEHDFFVSLASNGETARDMLTEHPWDMIIMDIMLPGIDGIQLIKLIRYKKINTPILILSALGELEDKIKGLDNGADDYLTKPFHFDELLSRINALTRRSKLNYIENNNILSYGSLSINLDTHTVYRNDVPVTLSPREYKLLLYLMENKNKVLSRTRLLKAVWGINYDNHTNVVDVYISYLRNKIEEGNSPIIHTIKGAGYILKVD